MREEGNLTFDRLDPRAEKPTAGMFPRLWMGLMALFVVGCAGCAVAWVARPREFYFAYLVGYLFCLTLVLGALFFVMLHHVTDAGWSVVVRRPAEQVLAAMPLLVILFVPVVVGLLRGELFGWYRQETFAGMVESKQQYLPPAFFIARMAAYFLVWMLLVRTMRRHSLRQDADGDFAHTFALRRWSGPGFLLYAVTFTFAAFDWIMSLQQQWFSTIFGVYVWAGAAVGGLALLTLIAVCLCGPLNGLISSDHLHDLGKLVFAFSAFWGYIAFSQYFLIWYGNIPEETWWFLHRWTGTDEGGPASTWWMVSVLLPVVRFVVPFVVMMSAAAKRRPAVLVVMSVVVLAGHYIDIYWMVMPVLNARGPAWGALWMSASALAAVGAGCGLMILAAMRRAALYPIRDPRLQESLMGEHVEEVMAGEVE